MFDYYAPTSVAEVLGLLDELGEDARLLAGGQSLLSMMKLRLVTPEALIDLKDVDGLDYVSAAEDGSISIGCMTRYVTVLESALLTTRCPALVDATRVVGDVQIRNRGTIGGAVAHADPAGDVIAGLAVHEATVRLVSSEGERWLALDDFLLGTYETASRPNELLAEIRVAAPEGQVGAYSKAAPRPSDFALAGTAVALAVDPDGVCTSAHVAITGVTNRPYRSTSAEQVLIGTAVEEAIVADAAESALVDAERVLDDVHAPRDYRQQLAIACTRRAVQRALSQRAL